jgi:hypothetical protein
VCGRAGGQHMKNLSSLGKEFSSIGNGNPLENIEQKNHKMI